MDSTNRKEVLLGNMKVVFHGMSSTINIEEAKKEFPSQSYLGTSSIMFVNGKEHLLEVPHRFFKFQFLKE